MPKQVLVAEGTLTLPYGVLKTLHYGSCEVRLYRNIYTQALQVGKRVSLLGREDTLAATEATFLREIDHDNVADIYDVAEVAGTDRTLAVIQMMMPYYEQGSVLDAMVNGRRFSSGEARDIALRSLRGVAHLHDVHKVLHRDLKPSNLFLTSDGTVAKVGDLGEAMRMDGEAAPPLLSPQFWTPPETFIGQLYTVQSDIYSMGMSLAEMLSGPFPYETYTMEGLSERLASGRSAVLPRHSVFQPHVPDSLRRIVRKSTRPGANGRYDAASEMIRALTRAEFVDWQWPTTDGQTTAWDGEWGGNAYRVVARPLRGRGWRVEAERRYASGWRRMRQCSADGSDPFATADTVFRQIDKDLIRA
ncbi:MAG: hypothetical protein QOI54_3196 [Actinomycetota bacterium]|jgi:serine/threonine protein kinase|nr:hypothetical protein [Actinomycetota bacterium]